MRALIIFASLLTFLACDSGPKVIEAQPSTDPHADASGTPAEAEQAPAWDEAQSADMGSGEHTVVAEEVLDTEKYSYIKVSENGKQYWIAASKMPVEIGATYIFSNGMEQKDFRSREHNRTFESLILVSEISKASETTVQKTEPSLAKLPKKGEESPSAIKPAAGAIRIADLMKNVTQYDGKTVKVTGKVMKVNPQIMGRNWIHLQDGSGENFDLTVTTKENIPQGRIVTMQGKVNLNKDFGAGYRYDIIIEDAVVVK
jgi:hypothetical protein